MREGVMLSAASGASNIKVTGLYIVNELTDKQKVDVDDEVCRQTSTCEENGIYRSEEQLALTY